MDALTETPEQRLFVNRVKVEAVPAKFAALFRPEPVEAFADAWVLTVQMHAFFETGRGRLLPPDARAVAIGAWDRLYGELLGEARQVAPGADVPKFEVWVKEWAAAHPIESLAARPSTASFFARLVAEPGLGATQAAGKIEEDLADLGARVDFLTATLPKQARWQAERLVLEAMNAREPRGLIETASRAASEAARATALLDRAIRLLEALPADVGAQREAALAGLRSEREALQAFADDERKAAFEALRAEREALLRDVDRQRVAGLAEAGRILERAVDRLALRLGAAVLLGGAVVSGVAFTLGRRSGRS
jgi:hypothetical protein